MKIGDRLGDLTLLALVEQPKFLRGKPRPWGLFQCACGKQKKIRINSVIAGTTRSCGCASQRAQRASMLAHRRELVANKGVRNPWWR